MTARKKGSSFAIISLALSLIGLGFLPLLMLNPPPSIAIPFQNLVIGTIFALICILGLIAAISPSHCTRFSKRRKPIEPTKTKQNSSSSMTNHLEKKGHHPTCDYYSDHVLQIRSRTFCAGCTGLAIGAGFTLVGIMLVFVGNLQFLNPVIVFWFGWGFVAAGLLQHFIYRLVPVQRGSIRFLLNVIFVVGAFLLLASLTQLTSNLILASYTLALIVYWIFTRIIMSRRSHQRICAQCESVGCSLSEA